MSRASCPSCGEGSASRWRCDACGALIQTEAVQVVELLSVSPRGRVYRAVTPDGQVALKELAFAVAPDTKSLELFEREARVLRQLSHPRIPRFVRSFREGDGPALRLYLAQSFIPGESLRARAEHHRFDEREARAVAREILGVLDYLHGLSPRLIHRDVKPGNIIAARSGGYVLVDFGSVRDLRHEASSRSTFAGTFGYMPPEQLMRHADERSDLYALGMTLASLLSQRAPTELLTPELEVELRPHVNASEGFVAFLERLLARAKAKRFSSASRALEALGKLAVPPLRTPARAGPGPAEGRPLRLPASDSPGFARHVARWLGAVLPRRREQRGRASSSSRAASALTTLVRPDLSRLRWVGSRRGPSVDSQGAVAWGLSVGREVLGLRPGYQFVVGRGPMADVSLQAAPHADTVSRLHAVLVVRPEGLQVRDLDSRNGILAGAVRVPKGQQGLLLRGPTQLSFGAVEVEAVPLLGWA